VPLRLVLAEDSTLMRAGLVSLLEGLGHTVVAAVGDGDALVTAAREHRPDLVITDVRMPPGFTDEGLTAARQIRREHPGTRIVVLSQHVDTAGAADLLADGADGVGYLLKRRVMNLDDFLDSVRRVAAGGSAIDPEVISAMVRREVRDNRDSGGDTAIASLTPRRVEVLELMAQGYSNARIARQLVVTEKAVARNIALIFQTLGLPPDPDEHRRVIAVIRYLNGRRPT